MNKRPNIIFIMADQLRYDALGCYGNTQIHTPNIDSLALEGSTFDNHFIQNPVCSPSRCSILTGRYPKNHGTRDNGIALRDEELTFPEMLRESGYRTAAIGKMHFTTQFLPKENEEDDWPEDCYGFDIVHTSCDTKTGEYLNWLSEISPESWKIVKAQGEKKAREDRASAAEKDISGPPQVYNNDIDPKYHQSTWIADQTIRVIEESDGTQPFFVWCSFVDPHHPFDPPQPYAHMYDPEKLDAPNYVEGELIDKPPHFLRHRMGRGFSNEKYDYRELSEADWKHVKAAYYGMITLIDDNIGRILQSVKQKGIEEDTLIIFTSDHGELLGDHGLLFKGPFMYDCLIKAPMLIKYPRQIPKGARFGQVTEHVDIMPTLLEYAQAPVPYGVQGMSMTPILKGDAGAGRTYAMTEFHCYDWGLDLKTITSKKYKLTYYADQLFGELYDREQDPQELVNLWRADDYRAVREELICQLLNRVIQTEDPLPIRTGKY